MPGPSYTKLNPFRTKNRASSTSSSSSQQGRKQYLARVWPWLSLSFGVLWLVPAVFVLALNFKDIIVGPSIGCLQSNNNCQLDLHSTTQINQAQSLAKDDQKALAGLQLAAKALDAWFCFIAASLVWTILRRLAGQDDTGSLPVGFVHIHTEVSDLRVLPKLVWGRRRDANRMTGWSKTRLYIFIAFVGCICVLCNLMGPATAVLVVPNLDWIPINQEQNLWFQSIMSNSRPVNGSIAKSCNDALLNAGKFSCTFKSYGASADMIIAGAVASNDQIFDIEQTIRPKTTGDLPFHSLVLPPILQEANLSFTVNISDTFIWIPNRQTLRDLSDDLTDYDQVTGANPIMSDNYPKSALFNRSLQTRLQRQGPVMGQRNLCFRDNFTGPVTIELDANRTVRCYERQMIDALWICMPSGATWPGINHLASSFLIVDVSRTKNTTDLSNQSNGNLTVSIQSATASLLMTNAVFQSAKAKTDFDWNTAFSGPDILPKRNISGPHQIFEYRRNIQQMDYATGKELDKFIWCESDAVLGVADYTMNPSQVSNIIRLAETGVFTEESPAIPAPQPLFVHPAWTLAAWSVDAVGGLVGGSRGAARRTMVAMENWLASPDGDFSQSAQDFRNIHKFMGVHTLSMIPFTTTNKKPADLHIQPSLSRKAMIQVYKYDLKGPTSIFGLIIVLFGVVLVVARTVMHTIDREEMKDATKILVTALKQVPKRPGHRRNASSTSSLQPIPSMPDSNLLDATDVDYDDDDDEKEFPVVHVSPANTPDLSGGGHLGTSRPIPYKRRISFHG